MLISWKSEPQYTYKIIKKPCTIKNVKCSKDENRICFLSLQRRNSILLESCTHWNHQITLFYNMNFATAKIDIGAKNIRLDGFTIFFRVSSGLDAPTFSHVITLLRHALVL